MAASIYFSMSAFAFFIERHFPFLALYFCCRDLYFVPSCLELSSRAGAWPLASCGTSLGSAPDGLCSSSFTGPGSGARRASSCGLVVGSTTSGFEGGSTTSGFEGGSTTSGFEGGTVISYDMMAGFSTFVRFLRGSISLVAYKLSISCFGAARSLGASYLPYIFWGCCGAVGLRAWLILAAGASSSPLLSMLIVVASL